MRQSYDDHTEIFMREGQKKGGEGGRGRVRERGRRGRKEEENGNALVPPTYAQVYLVCRYTLRAVMITRGRLAPTEKKFSYDVLKS